jgi:hypothetical protein
LTDVRRTEIANSLFESNGGASIRAVAATLDGYTIAIANNIINDHSTNAIEILTQAAANGSALSLSVDSNVIRYTSANADGANLSWNGPIAASFNNNLFIGSGGSNDGIDVAANSTTHLAQIAATQNGFTFSGGTDTAMRFTTLGPSQLSIATNSVTFDAAEGTGMNFTLAQSADVNIFDNLITDNVSRGTGILFSSIDGPSSLTINSNAINLLSVDALVDRGIIISAFTGDLTLSGEDNNSVTGATTPFFAPVGSIDGTIIVNELAVP